MAVLANEGHKQFTRIDDDPSVNYNIRNTIYLQNQLLKLSQYLIPVDVVPGRFLPLISYTVGLLRLKKLPWVQFQFKNCTTALAVVFNVKPASTWKKKVFH